MWVLMILHLSAAVPVTSIPFSSQASCEAALEAYEANKAWAINAPAFCTPG